jgi:ApaG protein
MSERTPEHDGDEATGSAAAHAPSETARAHKIRVDVSANYVGEQSKPEEGHYAFSYTITIRNEGQVPARLLTRHWVITDANGKVKEVRGEGVVGEQPVLAPGERFEYTSGVPLATASGFMTGRYQMVSESGERFEIDVPTFSLDGPDNRRVLN